MAEKKYFWFKLHVDFFKTKETKKLRKMAGGSVYTIIYLKLILLSLREKGKLYFEGIDDSFAEELALEIDETVEDVKMTLIFLEKVSLLEIIESDIIQLPIAVDNIGKETASAGRKRRQREREKMNCVTLSQESHKNVTTDIDIDKDLDKNLLLQEGDEESSLFSEDEKQAVAWIEKNLTLIKPDKRRALAKKHGLQSILILFEQFKADQKKKDMHMGYFATRLENNKRQHTRMAPLPPQEKARTHKGVYDGVKLGSMSEDEEMKRITTEIAAQFS